MLNPETKTSPVSEQDVSANKKDGRHQQAASYFSYLDLHFARFMERLDDRGGALNVFLAAALVSRCNRTGHVCADLSAYAGQKISGPGEMFCPSLAEWLKNLEESPVVGSPGEFKPLILDHKHRLYLQRYWKYEHCLAKTIIKRAGNQPQVDTPKLREALERLFPRQVAPEEIDWQKVAAAVAVCRRFCVITGGPGTGKTTTIARIMALLLDLEPGLAGRIALVAPTGKAADRMRTAIRQAKQSMDFPECVRRCIPEEAGTIHRLLGSIQDIPYFRHHAGNLLPVSLVIVDEASMVDLALLAKLLQALPEQCRLILMGDRDQLSSVEAGAVLEDICGPADQNRFSESFLCFLQKIMSCSMGPDRVSPWNNPLVDCIVHLHRNYRFPAHGSFAKVAQAVSRGDGQAALMAFSSTDTESLTRRVLPSSNELERQLRSIVTSAFSPLFTQSNPQAALAGLNRFRLLCALREGPYGVFSINSLVEKILHDAGLITIPGEWYAGRPIMLTANDYSLRLYNGDMGITLPDPGEPSELRVFFQGVDGMLRKFHPARLTAYETAYAVTVHKSQGSEYDQVILLLPAHDSPVLTRELLYTGLTRAKVQAEVWTEETVFRTAVSRRVVRFSGLGDILWQDK